MMSPWRCRCANTLQLKPEADLEMALLVVEEWLGQMTGEDVFLSGEMPHNPSNHRFADGSRYTFGRFARDWETVFSVRFSRKDADLYTRIWHTTVSFRRNVKSLYISKNSNTTDNLDINIELKNNVNNISAPQLSGDEAQPEIVVEAKITVEIEDLKPTNLKPHVTTPAIVGRLMKHLPLNILTPPLSITTLDEGDSLWELNTDIELPDRKYALLIICPNEKDEFPVNGNRLMHLTAGLAQVIRIGIEADWDEISGVLGKKYTPRSGEVKVILPVQRERGFNIAQINYSALRVIQMQTEGIDVEKDIFEQIVLKLNRIHSYRQNTPESVAKASKYQTFEDIKRHAEQTAEKHLTNEIEEIFNGTDRELEAYKVETQKLRDENRRLKYDLQSLQDIFQPHVPVSAIQFDIDYLKKVLDTVSDRFTPEDNLILIKHIFAERIIVLDSALKSAQDSRVFKEKRRAFNLLWRLATDYWQTLAEGKSDAQAKQIFGDDFSAKESESVENNKTARQLRTFTYNGRDIEMMPHLRIGIKDSPVETLRVHFQWLADEQKVIIGHCGKHLNFW